VFWQHHHGREDERQLAVVRAGQVESDRVVVLDVDLDNLPVGLPRVRAPPGLQKIPGKCHVAGGHRPSIREFRLRIELELDIGAIIGRIDRGGEEGVERKGLVRRATHQRVEDESVDPCGRGTVYDERIDAVEAALHGIDDAAAFGSVGIGVRERLEIRRKRRRPVHRDGRARLGACSARCGQRGNEDCSRAGKYRHQELRAAIRNARE
jgi:hypothetical protein